VVCISEHNNKQQNILSIKRNTILWNMAPYHPVEVNISEKLAASIFMAEE
jgi:hypothetical protein